MFHLLCCDISNFDPESGRSSHKTQHTQSRPPAPTHTCPRPPASPCTRSRPRFKAVCCDIWIFGRVWGPICEISQHSTRQTTQTPNHRNVTWFTHQFNDSQPRDVCCDIACFGPRFTSWLEISQHTSPGLRGSRCVWVSTVLLYLKIWPRIRALILQNAAHNSRREGRTRERAALNREGVDKQCETGPAHTGTQLHF